MIKKQGVILGIDLNIKNSMFSTTEKLYGQVGHNTGNLAFHYAIDSQLGGNLETLNWGSSTSHFDSQKYIAVLPCANQLGSHTDFGGLAEVFEKESLPMVAIGLGAQSSAINDFPVLTAGTLRWVASIIARSPSNNPNISVRGEYTLDVLKKYGLSSHATITGCPSLFLNPNPRLGKTISENFKFPNRIGVTAGHNLWTHLASIEETLFDLVIETRGTYIAQSALPMIKLARGEFDQLSVADQESCREYVNPNSSIKDFRKNISLYGEVFFNIPSWIEKYKRYDFVIGTRIHGIILALQAGIPAMCVVHDSRTVELCKTMMIPYIHASDFKIGLKAKDILDMWHFDSLAFDKNRLILAKNYLKFLENNNLKVDDSLINLCRNMEQEISDLKFLSVKDKPIQTSTVTALDRYPSIFESATRAIAERNGTTKVLSFGCSTGAEVFTLDSIYLEGCEIIGLDINYEAIKEAKTRPISNKNKISYFETKEFDYKQKFDVIFAMSVLCNWPQTQNKLYIKDMYSFDDFSQQTIEIDRLLNVGGFFVIHNSNYYFEDTTTFLDSYKIYDVAQSDIGFVTRFDKKSKPYSNNRSGNVIFQKIKDRDSL
jgi:chemotaxis methyl-accepting protein methylase